MKNIPLDGCIFLVIYNKTRTPTKESRMKESRKEFSVIISKVNDVCRIAKMLEKLRNYYPKIVTTMFSTSFGQNLISCGITKDIVSCVLLNKTAESVSRVEYQPDFVLNPKANRMYVISIFKNMKNMEERDHVFVIYLNSKKDAYLFQSNCYSNQSLLAHYEQPNERLGKKAKSFKIDLDKIIRKINHQQDYRSRIHNTQLLMKILTNQDFVLTDKERSKIGVDDKLITISKIALKNDHNNIDWLTNTDFFLKFKDCLD